MYYNPLLLKKAKLASKLKVAMVDDHILLLNGLAAIIDGFDGYKVIIKATNGAELIEELKMSPLPDIIVLDINMPVMDGYDTADWLVKNLPDIPVIVLTMFDSELMLTRMMQLGIRAFMNKNVHPSELNYAFDAVITQGCYYPQSISSKMAAIFQKAGSRKLAKKPVVFSQNEVKFLRWVGTDLTYKRIAEEMCVSERTVENYRTSLCQKLALRNRMELAVFAMRNGIIPF
ncbi:MAG TPA: response regulator transcription factor [Chitinophagaceae bacterium]|nr:response regulator transcription factor [Chitinophagaceae bacterium]